ncbi:hypothetical protein BDB01DRAFT_891228 [Pilobolus umbonatus]|nr:hypothetical protein BDB01DRAFT_891228 [Pilobolus umbonatus]
MSLNNAQTMAVINVVLVKEISCLVFFLSKSLAIISIRRMTCPSLHKRQPFRNNSNMEAYYTIRLHLFWKLQISLHPRTVWYRSIHRKLPCKQLLHPTPHCILYLSSSPGIDSYDHSLFLCPMKIRVWFSISPFTFRRPLYTFLLVIQQALSLSSNIRRTQSLPLLSLSLYQTFACTLLAIWSSTLAACIELNPFQ